MSEYTLTARCGGVAGSAVLLLLLHGAPAARRVSSSAKPSGGAGPKGAVATAADLAWEVGLLACRSVAVAAWRGVPVGRLALERGQKSPQLTVA